jgi:AbiV family abortive infection protein
MPHHHCDYRAAWDPARASGCHAEVLFRDAAGEFLGTSPVRLYTMAKHDRVPLDIAATLTKRDNDVVKPRQFRRLADIKFAQRLPLLVEGLEAIGANVERFATELDVCSAAGAYRAAQVLWNLTMEEAGKFLILIDSCRSPESDQATMSAHFHRAGNHLAKLIYAQMADYSIASQGELVRAIDMHRPTLHLDGPNDFDWIVPNALIANREGALYVDLVESEDELFWISPQEDPHRPTVPRPIRLVHALTKTGLVSTAGLRVLQDAWRGFDPTADTYYGEWAKRSRAALNGFASKWPVSDDWDTAAGWVVKLWPMPMVELDITPIEVKADQLADRRTALFNAWMAREYGFDTADEREQ